MSFACMKLMMMSRSRFLTRKYPKAYDFRVVSCKEYRGFSFVGVDSHGDTIHENLSAFWNLYQKYQKGDRIVKRKGEKALLLIHHADTACIHLSYKQDDL